LSLVNGKMATKRDHLRDAKPVNPLFHIFMCLVLRPLIFRFFKLRPLNKNIIPHTGPGILVANHVNFFDPIWIYDVLDRPMYFVATEELFRSRVLSVIVRLLGLIPFRRQAQDFQSIRNIIKLLQAGGLIGIYPEGTRTWDGINAPIIPTIARIIRRMRVPVFSCRVEGGYLHFPRWADKWRPIRVRLIFDQLYTGDTIPDSEEQVIADIAEAIHTSDYELRLPEVKGRVPGLAAGIQKILYRCPNCQSVESLKAAEPLASNQVQCHSCFATWEVDLGSRLTPVDEDGEAAGESRTVAEIYRQIKVMPLKPIRSSLIRLEEGEKLYLVSRPHFLYREKQYPELRIFGFGRAFLTNRRFVFRGRLKKRGRVRLAAPLEEIDSLTIEPGDKLHFIYRKHLYRIPFRRESPVKWHDYLERLIELRKNSSKPT
jgi:1-acyl-sn-glycerol-3-phosphate acyltransferase